MRNFIALVITIVCVLFSIYLLLDMIHWVWLAKERVERVVYDAIDDESKVITTREGTYEIVYDVLRKQHLMDMEEYYEWKCKNKGEKNGV